MSQQLYQAHNLVLSARVLLGEIDPDALPIDERGQRIRQLLSNIKGSAEGLVKEIERIEEDYKARSTPQSRRDRK